MFKLLFLGTYTVFFSCDPIIGVTINGFEHQWETSFACGKANIRVSSMGAHIFTIASNYKVFDTLYINTDSIKVTYRGTQIPYFHYVSNKKTELKQVAVSSASEIKMEFDIKEGVRVGEVINLETKGYLYCGNNPVQIDRIYLQITKDSK